MEDTGKQVEASGLPQEEQGESQSSVFHRHGEQSLTQELRETQSLGLSVCLEICPVWMGKV